MLAVKANYDQGEATIGTAKGKPVPVKEILAAIESIGYRGQFVNNAVSTAN